MQGLPDFLESKNLSPKGRRPLRGAVPFYNENAPEKMGVFFFPVALATMRPGLPFSLKPPLRGRRFRLRSRRADRF